MELKLDDAALATLIPEARELLADMERALLAMESEGPSAERVAAVFRAAHTIKGSAGLFGLNAVVSFTQVVESVLDRVRSGALPLDVELASLLLHCADYIGRLVDALEQQHEDHDPAPEARAALLTSLQRRLGSKPDQLSLRAPESAASVGHWHVSLRLGRSVLQNGMDPLSMILYLRTLGSILYLHTLSDDLPPLELYDPELCYLGFELGLRTEATRESLEAAFAFVRDDAEIILLPPSSQVADYIQVIERLPRGRTRLGEMLVASGALSQRALDEALRAQSTQSSTERPRLGELLVERKVVPTPVVAAALGRQKQADERRNLEQRVLKVDAHKLDQLIDLVGELVIASEGARLLSREARGGPLLDTMIKVGQLVEQVRDRALDLRMIPIGDVFQRFPRVVRDVSQELGKEIELVITGAESELDKSMVEKLSDPLLHLVRNAIDHGIEGVEERRAAGKPVRGRLHLHAHHESGAIVIEIADDGRGLDPLRIRNKAVERGLIALDQVLSEAEIQQLIFLPGFSTASHVTNLSGRGVGMDVVRSNVEQLRGVIEIESEPGQGTRLRLRLPLTLAIIDGFQVAIADTVFVLPLESVVECVDMKNSAAGGQNLLNLRGEPLPYLRLRELFEVEAKRTSSRESVVVVHHGQQRVGLVVDRLLGDAQAVIKPLGCLFRGTRAISSSTVLGDGTVALILDVASLVERAASHGHGDRISQGALAGVQR